MTRRIIAIIAIYLCTTAAWAILGATIFARTYSADSSLQQRVASSWGSPQRQTPPTATGSRTVQRAVQINERGEMRTSLVDDVVTTPLALEQSRINVDLDLEQRQKGLLWFATYRVGFRGSYRFRNTSDSERVTLKLAFPAANAIYDDLLFLVDGAPVALTNADNAVSATVMRPPGALIRLDVGYRSQGLTSWHYGFGDSVSQVKDFLLTMRTDFYEIDFPEGTLSPTTKEKTAKGWTLVWRYRNLVTGYQIGMLFPEKLQPGPLAGRISFFAPVSLLFFFFLMLMITALRGIDLHPMNYFFLAAAFFSFHLLLAYLVDHISIHLAFVICSAVSIFLVVSYLRLVTGLRFATVEAGITQFVYLVLFSYAFFFKGFTGLAITIGAILTLFVVMQVTGRIRWSERFAKS
jgi:inner membrane protein involved in colicin E2 resistance